MSRNSEDVFDYRQTFLREHVQAVLTYGLANPKDSPSSTGILAVDYLVDERTKEAPQPDSRPVQAELFGAFFDENLYQPVGVTPLDGQSMRFESLTALLKDPRVPPNVALVASSGTGKTVALLKAFRDCFLPEEDPPLAGWVPVILPLDSPASAITDQLKLCKELSGEELDTQLDQLARCLFRQAAFGPTSAHDSPSEDLLKKWLHNSPPMLLFAEVTIHTWPEAVHAVLKAQRRFRADGLPHRCVMACHESRLQIDAFSMFRQGGEFSRFTLAPLDPAQARDYLAAFGELRGKCSPGHATNPVLPLAADLLSSPLLLHFVSVLDADQLRNIKSKADLYDAVVTHLLGRAKNRPGVDPLPTDKLRTALVRLALIILARGDDQVVLGPAQPSTGWQVYSQLLRIPETQFKPDKLKLSWIPSPFWTDTDTVGGSPYYESKFDPSQIETLRTSPLLSVSADNKCVGFFHDSFMPFFAAIALRYYKGPGLPIPEEDLNCSWYEEVVKRVREGGPKKWAGPAEFLGGLLEPDEVEKLAALVLKRDPSNPQGWPRFLRELVRGRRRPPGDGDTSGLEKRLEKRLRLLEQALRRPTVYRWPRALPSVCYRHLTASPEPTDPIREALTEACCDWLKVSDGTPPPPPQIAHLHAGPVRQLVVTDQTVLSLGQDGALLAWDPDRGESSVVVPAAEAATVFALTRDGRVVVGHENGLVAAYPRSRGPRQHLYRTNSPVTALLIIPDDRDEVIIAGHEGGTVFRVPLSLGGSRAEFVGHRRAVRALAHAKGVIYSGADDGLRCWGDGDGQAKALKNPPPGGVRALAVGPQEQLIAGFADGGVMAWDLKTDIELAQPVELIRHHRGVAQLLVTAAGIVVSGHEDGSVFAARVGAPGQPPEQPNHALRHRHPACVVGLAVAGPRTLSVDAQGGIITYKPPAWAPQTPAAAGAAGVRGQEQANHLFVVGGNHGTLRVDELKDGHSHAPLLDSAVVAIEAFGGGCWATRSGKVVFRDRRPFRLKAGVRCTVVVGDLLVLGTEAGEIAFCDEDGNVLAVLPAARGPVTALGFDGKEELAWADAVGFVRSADVGSLRAENRFLGGGVTAEVYAGVSVTCLLSRGNGCWLLGRSDGVIASWSRDERQVEELTPEGRPVVEILDGGTALNFAVHADGAVRRGDADGNWPPVDSPERATVVCGPWPRSEDGTRVVTGAVDGSVWCYHPAGIPPCRLWEPAEPPHIGPVTCIAASQAGLLATAGADGVVLLWDAPGAEPVAAFEAGTGVSALRWLGDDELAVGLVDGAALFLSVVSGGNGPGRDSNEGSGSGADRS